MSTVRSSYNADVALVSDPLIANNPDYFTNSKFMSTGKDTKKLQSHLRRPLKSNSKFQEDYDKFKDKSSNKYKVRAQKDRLQDVYKRAVKALEDLSHSVEKGTVPASKHST